MLELIYRRQFDPDDGHGQFHYRPKRLRQWHQTGENPIYRRNKVRSWRVGRYCAG